MKISNHSIFKLKFYSFDTIYYIIFFFKILYNPIISVEKSKSFLFLKNSIRYFQI